MTMINII